MTVRRAEVILQLQDLVIMIIIDIVVIYGV